MRRLARAGALRAGVSSRWQWTLDGEMVDEMQLVAGPGYVTLSYRLSTPGKPWASYWYPVSIEYTPCPLGGARPWFLCPAEGCGRRVAILYLDRVFACRHCHRLAYASTRETSDDRAARRADRIRGRLGWAPGILNGPGRKPKWMRWRTFVRLASRHEALVGRSMREGMARLEGLDRVMGGSDAALSPVNLALASP